MVFGLVDAAVSEHVGRAVTREQFIRLQPVNHGIKSLRLLEQVNVATTGQQLGFLGPHDACGLALPVGMGFWQWFFDELLEGHGQSLSLIVEHSGQKSQIDPFGTFFRVHPATVDDA